MRDGPARVLDLREVGVPVRQHRRAHRDENQLGAVELCIGRDETRGRTPKERLHLGLAQRILATKEPREPIGVALRAHDVVPCRGERERTREADVPGSDDGQAHRFTSGTPAPRSSRPTDRIGR